MLFEFNQSFVSFREIIISIVLGGEIDLELEK